MADSRRAARGADAWRALPLVAVIAGWCAPLQAQREFAIVPKPGTDFTAYRFDTKVLGWNGDFSELATVAIEINRNAESQQRGDVTLLVFEIGATVPKQKVFLLNHTQAAFPDDPMPLVEIGDRDWAAGKSMQDNWWRRPLPRCPIGGMHVETLWTPIELSDGRCQPRVGFLLEHEGRLRYETQRPLRVWAPCDELRLTDDRTQWAKTDLAAVILRFHFTPASGDRLFNERSARFALSAAWHRGRPLQMVVRTPEPQGHRSARLRRLVHRLTPLGSVQVQHVPGGAPAGVTVATKPHLAPLRQWLIRHALDRETVAAPAVGSQVVPAGADVLVAFGSKPAQQPRASALRPQENKSAYLNDWALH